MSNLRNLFKLVAVATVVAGVVAEVDDGVLDEPEAAPPDIIEGEDEGYDEIAGALVFSFDDDGGGGSAFTMGDDDVGSAAAACDPGVGVAIIDGFTVRYTPSDGTCKTGFTLVNTDVNTDCLHTIPDGATIATEGSGFKIEGDAAFDALLARAFDGQISAGGETLIFGATGKELKVWVFIIVFLEFLYNFHSLFESLGDPNSARVIRKTSNIQNLRFPEFQSLRISEFQNPRTSESQRLRI